MVRTSKSINMTQDVYDKLVGSFIPKEKNSPTQNPGISSLHLGNPDDTPFDINVVSGQGFLTIEGSVTEKQLRQLSNILNSTVVHQYEATTNYGDNNEHK